LAKNTNAKTRKTLSKRIPRIGRVVFSEESNAVHCSVREFTDTSAMITMSGWLALPSNFILYVEPDSIRAECRVIKRHGNNIELEFTSLEENIRFRDSHRAAQTVSAGL